MIYLKLIPVLFASVVLPCFSQCADHKINTSVQTVFPCNNVVANQTISLKILIKLGDNDSIKRGDVLELYGKIDGNTVELTRLLAVRNLGPDTTISILISGSFQQWNKEIYYTPSGSGYNGLEHVYIDDAKDKYQIAPYFKHSTYSEILSFHGIYPRHCILYGFRDSAAKRSIYKPKYYVHFDTLDLNSCLIYKPYMFVTMSSLEVDYYSLSGEISVNIKGLSGQQPWTLSDRTGRVISSGNFIVDSNNRMNMGTESLPPGRYTLTVGEGSDELTDYFTVL